MSISAGCPLSSTLLTFPLVHTPLETSALTRAWASFGQLMLKRKEEAGRRDGGDRPSTSMKNGVEMRWGYGGFGERKTVVHPLEKEQALVEGKVSMMRQKKAAERQALHGKNPGVMSLGKKTLLDRRAVGVTREKSYRRAWDKMKSWAEDNHLSLRTIDKLDHALANRINLMFFEGMDPADAATLVAAVKYYREDVTKLTNLPRTTEAMKGFRKLEPAQGRLPLPWPMLCVIIRAMWDEWRAVALWLLMVWATCGRPGEVMKMRKRDLVPPSPLCQHWVVILNASPSQGVKRKAEAIEPAPTVEEKTTSKVGESDEAVLIDQPYMKGFGRIVKNFAQKLKPDAHLFTFDVGEAVKLWNKILNKQNYVGMGINCTYQLRHGSASTDVLTNLSLMEVQKRGRWGSQKSVRRYSNGGRVSQVFDSLDAEQKAEAAAAERWMLKIFGGGGK